MQFGVSRKWKSWAVKLMFSVCSNYKNTLAYSYLTAVWPEKGILQVFGDILSHKRSPTILVPFGLFLIILVLCKKCAATFWANFGGNYATFFPSSGHTARQTPCLFVTIFKRILQLWFILQAESILLQVICFHSCLTVGPIQLLISF